MAEINFASPRKPGEVKEVSLISFRAACLPSSLPSENE